MDRLTASLNDRLRSSGFRLLSAAQLAAGPFARRRGELRSVRLEGASYATASIAALESERDAVRVVEELNWDFVGYDLNMAFQAHLIETLDEVRLFLGEEQPSSSSELTWRGYRQTGSFWVKIDRAFPVPALEDGFAGEIFPCLGWVPRPNETSEFGMAEQRRGFCSKIVPANAQAILDVRGYHFIHEGYAERPVVRRQILVFVEEGCHPSELIDDALALNYDDA